MNELDPQKYLDSLRHMPDQDIDVAVAAICLAARNHLGRNLQSSFHHLNVLVEEVSSEFSSLLDEGDVDTCATRLVVLKEILANRRGYTGNREDYDNLSNADLIHVMDTRRGLPIALCILYIHAGRAQGWNVNGLGIPGHYLCRIEKDGQSLIFDPFYDCGIVDAPQIRALVKKLMGESAELRPEYFEPASNRDLLIRLQNNIKLRQVEADDYVAAVKTIEDMRKISPDDLRLLFDSGVLYSKVGQSLAAMKALQGYIEKAPNAEDSHDAQILLRNLRESLH